MSADSRVSEHGAVTALDARWRSDTARAQEAVLPTGRVVVSCSAPFGVGGLGRHVREIVDALDRRGQPSVRICGSDGLSGLAPRLRSVGSPGFPATLTRLMRFSPAWRIWAASVRFDGDAARRLPAADHLIAFNGTAQAQFRAAKRARYESASLISANSHMRRVIRQHARAHRQYPVDRPWATLLLRRNLREYAQADRIYVASRYVWESFSEEGFPDDVLSCFPLTPDPRYEPAGAELTSTASERTSGTFDIVYVGSLTVHKGIPLLLDAFSRLPYPDIRLVLVGGWKTRGMRRFIQNACVKDARISVSPGDPLPHLRAAQVCVHPAYEDGFAYAPAEALACGVPVIVSEDTGMKDLIDSDRNGLVLPTGDPDALAQAIEAAYRGEIFGA